MQICGEKKNLLSAIKGGLTRLSFHVDQDHISSVIMNGNELNISPSFKPLWSLCTETFL